MTKAAFTDPGVASGAEGTYTSLATIHGFAIQVRRKEQGMSQAGLAERCGLSQATISRIELGEADITLSQMYALCRALDIDVAELIQTAEKIREKLADVNINVTERTAKYNSDLLSKVLPSVAVGIVPIIGVHPIGWVIGSIALKFIKNMEKK